MTLYAGCKPQVVREVAIRVKKKHIRDNPLRLEAMRAAMLEFTGCEDVAFAADDRGEHGTVAVCYKKKGGNERSEYLLGKAADDFLAGKPNTLKPFRFYARKGWFA